MKIESTLTGEEFTEIIKHPRWTNVSFENARLIADAAASREREDILKTLGNLSEIGMNIDQAINYIKSAS